MRSVGIEDVTDKEVVLGTASKLIGGGTDGAANVGVRNGLKEKMQVTIPWLFWSWCFSHRLELACKGGLSSTLLKEIDEMLLRLFYIYQKSAKKSKELTAICDDLK